MKRLIVTTSFFLSLGCSLEETSTNSKRSSSPINQKNQPILEESNQKSENLETKKIRKDPKEVSKSLESSNPQVPILRPKQVDKN